MTGGLRVIVLPSVLFAGAIAHGPPLAPIFLALGLVGLTYLWAVELMGAVRAVLPADFLAFRFGPR